MPIRRIVVFVLFMVSVAATAAADTVRVVVDRALVWTRPGGVSIVMNQLLRDQTAEVVRRVGDWYEIVAPPGSGGGDQRTGFISASQVVLEPGGPPSAQAAPAGRTSPVGPDRSGEARSDLRTSTASFVWAATISRVRSVHSPTSSPKRARSRPTTAIARDWRSTFSLRNRSRRLSASVWGSTTIFGVRMRPSMRVFHIPFSSTSCGPGRLKPRGSAHTKPPSTSPLCGCRRSLDG